MFSGWSLALHWRSIQLVKVRSQGCPRDERGDNKSHPDQSLLIFTERHFATEGDILRMASQKSARGSLAGTAPCAGSLRWLGGLAAWSPSGTKLCQCD